MEVWGDIERDGDAQTHGAGDKRCSGCTIDGPEDMEGDLRRG